MTGKFDIVNFKSVEDLVKKTKEIISLTDDELLKMKKKSRAWVKRCHSYRAVGERLLNLYKKIL